MAQRIVIPGFRKIETSGGGEGGSTNYDDLTNKPSINNVPLVGKLKTVDLKLTDATLTEEGVPADAKIVGQKLEEQSTSLTALSEQLGKHTVKSDVPENAVFTDTVYDDAEVKEDLTTLKKETIVNLLNPILKTGTLNGITCTNNDDDGTYTLSGTATSATFFNFILNYDFKKGIKIVGCPSNGSSDSFGIFVYNVTDGFDYGNGFIFTKDVTTRAGIYIASGYNCDNLVFKPMITTNLDATYGDFVPYTGDTGKLSSDVASLLKRIETLESLVNKTDTTVTE